MPRGRDQTKQKNRKSSKAPPRKTKRRRRRRPQLGQHFARATRAVLAQLPGSAITQPVADFIFNLFGVSNEKLDPQGGTVFVVPADKPVTVYATGMYGAFLVYPRMFMGTDPRIGSIFPPFLDTKTSKPSTFNPMVKTVGTQFTDARMVDLRIDAHCTGPPGSVSGSWALGFAPFRCDRDQLEFLTRLKTFSSFEYISMLPLSQIDKVSKTLSLRYKFNAIDGRAGLPGPLDLAIGVVVIAYEDVMRSSGTSFSPEDFQCTIDCSSTVEYSARDPSNVWYINNVTSDPLAGISAIVKAANGIYAFSSDSIISNSRGKVSISGKATQVSAGGNAAPYPAGGKITPLLDDYAMQ